MAQVSQMTLVEILRLIRAEASEAEASDEDCAECAFCRIHELAEAALKVISERPREISCGCCTGGCVCQFHQDVPMGIPARVCEYHRQHPHRRGEAN